jgi:hypothetical protein
MSDASELVKIQPLVPRSAIESFNVSVVLASQSGLNQRYPLFGCPLYQGPWYVLRAVITAKGSGLTAPFNGRGKGPY